MRRGLRAVDSSRGRVRRVIPIAVGVGLLFAALWVVADHRGTVAEGVHHAAGSPWWAVTLVVVFPVLSLIMTSTSLWLLTRRYGPVGYGEMHALVAGAMLLNFLPMRPGLLGRLAYHKRVNGIQVRDSVRVLIEAHQTAQTDGRRIQLANPSSAVSRLLEISGIDDYLNVTD